MGLFPPRFQQIWDKACPSELGGHREFYIGLESCFFFFKELVGPLWAEALGPGRQPLQLPGALALRHRALWQEVWTRLWPLTT